MKHGSDWGLIIASEVRGDTPIRIGEFETTPAELVHRAVVSAAQQAQSRAARSAKPAWSAGAPRLSERDKARHPETVFIASGSMPPWSEPRPEGGFAKRMLAALADRWRALTEDTRMAIALGAGLFVFAAIAGIVFATTLIA
jgi:hypothetical protein